MSSPPERGPAAEPRPMLPDAYAATSGPGPAGSGPEAGGSQPGGPQPGLPQPNGPETRGPQSDAPQPDRPQPVWPEPGPADQRPGEPSADGSQPGAPQPGSQGAGRPQPGYGKLLSGDKPLWTEKPGGRTIFRMPAPLVLWWAWLVFGLVLLINVLVTDVDIHALRAVAILLIITGVVYATTLHPRVETDAEGLTVFNPLFDHRMPWGAVEGIFLGDSVEFRCFRPEPKKAKTIYSWALYSRRRARARKQMQPVFFMGGSRRVVSNRAPVEAADLAKQPAAQIMAAELGRRAADARDRGAAPGYLQRTWAWRSVAAILAPAVLLLIAILVS